MKTTKVFIRSHRAKQWHTKEGDWYVPVLVASVLEAGVVEVEVPTSAVQGGWFHPGNCPKIKTLAKNILDATTTTTRDGIEVKAGQYWRDLDKRMNKRTVYVEHVEPGYAFCRSVISESGEADGRAVRLSICRMHRHSTGFELVS
jgi:hypothetical protein